MTCFVGTQIAPISFNHSSLWSDWLATLGLLNVVEKLTVVEKLSAVMHMCCGDHWRCTSAHCIPKLWWSSGMLSEPKAVMFRKRWSKSLPCMGPELWIIVFNCFAGMVRRLQDKVFGE